MTNKIQIRPYDQRRDAEQLPAIQWMWRRGMRAIPRVALRRYAGALCRVFALFLAPELLLISMHAGVYITVAAVAVLIAVPSAAIFLYYYYCNSRYIAYSLRDDWWRLDEVYARPGGLWVAVDTSARQQYPASGGRVVGLIGLDAHVAPSLYDTPDLSSPVDAAKNKAKRSVEIHAAADDDDDDTAPGPRRRMELRRMVVHPDYRGRGIAKQLLDTLIEHAREYRAREVYLTMVHLQPLASHVYRRHGFQLRREFPTRPFLYVHEYVLDIQ